MLKDLNDQQKVAVKATEGPVLVLAGAGSGKTKVLTHRVAYLISYKSIAPENILLVTFTNKAATEMKNRVANLIGASNVFAGTFHSLCAKILRNDGQEIGIGSKFIIYDESDTADLIKEILKRMDLSPKNFSPAGVKTAISQVKNEMIEPNEYPKYARGFFQETVADIYLSYQKALNKNGALDFDDLLLETIKLFQKSPDTLGNYRNKFQYVLVDEFQDTNKAQYEIVRLLTKQHRNLCAVGDFSQSIYSWRGADYKNLMRLKEDYPEIKTLSLEQNYRSTQKILDAAYAVISRNRTHPVLKLWTANDGGGKINLYEAESEEDEARYVIKSLVTSQLSNYAVLYRTNAQSRVFEEAFLHAGVPYVLVGGVRFYDRKEVKDILSYLRLLMNPKDSVSAARIEKIGKGRAQKFYEFASLATNQSSLGFVNGVIQATNYLELFDVDDPADVSRLENIKELRSVAEQFPDLVDFLENVALVEKEGRRSQSGEAVTLMTLHSAKGLEFDTVFLVGMEEGLFPHSRSLMDRTEMEEERRLCYVGITRAKRQLHLTYARRRLFFGTRSQNMVSRFVGEIPERLLTIKYTNI